MTGEITLRGKVLPIGGLKEKMMAAHRMGVFEIIFPKDNEKDLADIPQNIREAMKMHPVDSMDEVLKIALERMPIALAESSQTPVSPPTPADPMKEQEILTQ
jgi:ATP-dependent Lon protease